MLFRSVSQLTNILGSSTNLTIAGDPAAGVSTVDLSTGTPQLSGINVLTAGLNASITIDLGNSGTNSITTATSTQNGVASGSFTPVITSLGGDLDLSSYTFSLNLSQVSGLTVVNGVLTDGSGNHIILPTSLAAGQTITLDAAQLQGGALNLTGAAGSAVVITGSGPDPLSGVDLSGLNGPTATLSLSGSSDLTNSTLTGLSEILLNGSDLTAGVNNIAGISIGGAGNITISGTVSSGTPDLSGLVVASGFTIDLTGISGTVVLPNTVNAGETLLVNSDQFGTPPQTIDNSGTLTITSNGGPAAPDFGGITTETGATTIYEIVGSTSISSAANLNGVTVQLDDNQTLVIDANALNGQTVIGANGAQSANVVVTGIATSALDLSGLATSLTVIDLAQFDLNGQTLILPSTVASGQVLNLNPSEMTGQTVTVSGVLQVSAGDLNVTQTVSGIDLSNVSGTGMIAVDVIGNTDLTNDNLGSATVTISGTTVLSNIDYGTASIYISGDATISGTVTGITNASFSVGGGATLTSSISDASGVSVNGVGAVNLTGSPSAAVDLHLMTAPLAVTWSVPTGAVTLPNGSNLGTAIIEIARSAPPASQNTLSAQASAVSGVTVHNTATGSVLGQLDLTGTYTNAIDLSDVATRDRKSVV